MRLPLCTALVLAACATVPQPPPEALASAQVVPDLDSYVLRRVGLLPLIGPGLSGERAAELQSAFFAELSAASRYEVVQLSRADLSEVPRSEPYRRGWYEPRTIIDLARRYRLDAVFVGTVTDEQPFPPQRLGVQLDLVASETGLVIWSAAAQLDASQERVVRRLEAWAHDELGESERQDVHLILISPRRFARFAAHEIAAVL